MKVSLRATRRPFSDRSAIVVFIMRPVSVVAGSVVKPLRNTSYDFVVSIYAGT